MSPFAVDKRDVQFCLYEFLNAENLCKLPKYKEFNKEVFDMVLDEAVKFSTEILAPLNIILDREGVGFDKGKVTTGMTERISDAFSAWVCWTPR